MYRKRFIPDEIVDISKDKLMRIKSGYLITNWEPINPRNDIGSGTSYTFFKDGFKISKFYDANRRVSVLVL